MNVLLFTGAGASVELGVPAMRAMAEAFHEHLCHQDVPESVTERFVELLSDARFDMERLIEVVEGIEKGLENEKALGLDIDEERLTAFRVIRHEAEWYVQHVCEKLNESYAPVLWGPVLRKLGDHRLLVATTNYDRSFEMGCTLNGLTYDDGFGGFSGREFAEWQGIKSSDGIVLLKIHGSTDWYQSNAGRVYKLKHPMPLYGGLMVSDKGGLAPQMTNAFVLPTREKRVSEPPYPELTTEFRTLTKETDVAIFVGTSFRDPDILDVCRQCAERVPTFVVSRSGVFGDVSLPSSAKVIKQCASMFIVSVLPKFLRSGEVSELEWVTNDEAVQGDSVVGWLTTALDDAANPSMICNAIEELADRSVSVDHTDLSKLLGHEEPSVREFAVALLQGSVDQEEAMEAARNLATETPHSSFAKEFRLLEELLERSKT